MSRSTGDKEFKTIATVMNRRELRLKIICHLKVWPLRGEKVKVIAEPYVYKPLFFMNLRSARYREKKKDKQTPSI